ncbi:MAG: Lin0512 family protein [Stellaceae bacterium]
MATKRVFLEVGSGNDWHGGDYTKAARRAVEDALHHSSLILLKTLDLAAEKMLVEVTIGVQKPEKIDAAKLKAIVPHGEVKVTAVKGGLDIQNAGPDDVTVIAAAAIVVHLDLA